MKKQKKGARSDAVRARAREDQPRPRTRRGLLLAASLLLVAAGAAAWWWLRAPGLPAFVRGTDQNILLITLDTVRGDALGCYGGTAETPILDRLAADGVRFDFAHAHAVLTLPSHTSILSGLYPFQHGIRDNSGFRVDPTTATLCRLSPSSLRARSS